MGKKLINLIASGFYISYIPYLLVKRNDKLKGCGFAGTTLAFCFWWSIPREFINFLLFSVVFIFFAIIISEKAFEKDIEKDNPLIVIDEIAGYFFSFIFVEKNLKNAIILFIIFRVFDTLKPFPIKKLENIKQRGISIFIDDIVAGFYTSIVAWLINRIFLS